MAIWNAIVAHRRLAAILSATKKETGHWQLFLRTVLSTLRRYGQQRTSNTGWPMNPQNFIALTFFDPHVNALQDNPLRFGMTFRWMAPGRVMEHSN